MLNTGTKELDKIPNLGKLSNMSMRLGYCGEQTRKTQTLAATTSGTTIFVHLESKSTEVSMKEQLESSSNTQMVKRKVRVKNPLTFKRRCNSCGHQSHIARYCYERINNIKKAWKSGLIYPESKCYDNVWIPKSVLYARQMEDEYDDEFDVICNIAQIGGVEIDSHEEKA
ncbi:hypothetical protein DY000_02017199 [Brassica cretica]|uniref:CCHC-type domain-containing protein n=1 Tax=Brassica cretica TaxID=69181 RepID=A0ABQ7CR09_BRACR|nr:hypothetical protein DY000_02017199 [Brassica cretica]